MSKNTVVEITNTLNAFAANYDSLRRTILKGKINKNIDLAAVEKAFKDLDEQIEELKACIPQGNENISKLAADCNKILKNMQKLLGSEFAQPVLEAASDLSYLLDIWHDVLTIPGTIAEPDPVDSVSYQRRKVQVKLDFAVSVYNKLMAKRNSLETELLSLEAQRKEVNAKIVGTTNQRLISSYYTLSKELLNKINTKSGFSNHIFECASLLDRVCDMCKDFLESGNENSKLFKLVRATLNVDNFENIVSDPHAALASLKVLEEEVRKLLKPVLPPDTNFESNAALDEEANGFREQLLAEMEAEKAAAAAGNIENINPEENKSADNVVNKIK